MVGNTADTTAGNAERDARRAMDAIQLLQCDVERLLMITEALWTFLKQQHGYNDEDLDKLVAEIDLQDGKLDGRVASPPYACPHCGHTLGRRRPFCFYCGKPVPVTPFER